ncbi:splicing factor 3A subunit 1 [Tetranychus urticae]|uniref:Splicing factor 3A subunit 1 n=1 Tax=Tetranychus urticae TaxID=32264 RepID=T1JZD7_TETUR|nr:splicing factor 3A subunit 1 [Tetranychus urticae]
MSGETIGIIYPPPELRNIVDKTASFVARNGPEFETRIQQNEQNNPKFNFLKAGDPYHAYYQYKVKEFKEGSKGSEISAPPSTVSNSFQPAQNRSIQPQQNRINKQLELFAETAFVPKDPPPDFEFSAEPPSISALDLDIVKLTAQFVAVHGRSFLTNLMNREQRNFQFDFLRPQHGMFGYFTQLIEQYTKILMPAKNLVPDLQKEIASPSSILAKVRYRQEWAKIQEAEKRREQEEAERERIQYAQIDWHDFVIVETVDYQLHEQGLFPPPTTPESVGSRLLLQQRIEEQGQEAVEMDVDSDEELDEIRKAEKAKESMPPPLPPLPPQLDNVVIRKDYNPKAKTQAAPVAAATKTAEAWVVSPITGEKIPAEKLQEHMRYGLLDPRWVEQRERALQEKMQQEEVYASGSAIDMNLKELAERRSDIFGSGDEETAIGKKIGEEERKKPEKVTWDGYTASMEAATRAARANISIKDQIQQIHRTKGLLPDEDKERIGPTLPSSSQANQGPPVSSAMIQAMSGPPPTTQSMSGRHHHHHHQQQQKMDQQPNQPQMPTMVNLVNPLTGGPRGQPHPHSHPSLQQPHVLTPQQATQFVLPPGAQPNGPPFMIPTPQMMMGMYGITQIPTMPPNEDLNPNSVSMSISQDDEPPFKKSREDSMVPEDEFMRRFNGPVTFQVKVPEVPDKPEWNLQGQTVNLTLPLTDMVSVIKAKIHEQLGLPPGKQKLQFGSTFIKDSNTLAFCNIGSGATLTLGLKERGGRKK